MGVWRVGSAIVAVCAVVTIVYWPALSAQAFSLDDPQYVLENPLVRAPSWAGVGRVLSEVRKPSTVSGYYQPLTMISLMLDTALGGRADDFRAYHRTSLALHVANAALVLLLLYQLFGNLPAAAAAALLFGIHPVTLEPVPWVAERKTLLAAFFALGCLNLYVRYTRGRSYAAYVACVLLFVLGLLSKPTITPLPLLLLLLDYWPLRRLRWRTVAEKIPLLAAAGVFAAITILSQRSAAGLAAPTGNDPLRIGLTICHNIVFYLRAIVWPVGLTWHYPFPTPFDLRQPELLAGVIGTPLLIVLAAVSLRWTRAVLVGGAFFFLGLLPTMNIVGFTYILAGFKYVYLPVVGLLLPLAAFLSYLWRRRTPRLLSAGLLVVLAGLEAYATRGYLGYWHDTERLHRYMLSVTPEAFALHFNLGLFLERHGRVDEAVAEYQRVLAARPDHWRALAALADCYLRQEKPAEALPYLDAMLKREPNDVSTHRNLGAALAALGRTGEAVVHYQAACALDPADFRVRINLGSCLATEGRFAEALACFDEALRLNPGSARAHYDRGIVLRRLDRDAEAVEEYRAALRIEPNYAAAKAELEATLQWLGRH